MTAKKRRPYTPSMFERQLLGFLERRIGRAVDEELVGTFAQYLHEKKGEYNRGFFRALMRYRET